MISYLEGKVIFKGKDFLILNVNGVGYKIFLAEKALQKIERAKPPCKLFIFLYLKRTTIELYGLLSPEELKLFETLEAIAGIGPKTALSLASFGTLEDLKKAIKEKDSKLFSQIRGMGKKRTQRLILELTDSFEELEKKDSSKEDEVFKGLCSLGFSKKAVRVALSKVAKDIEDPKGRIKEALKFLGKR